MKYSIIDLTERNVYDELKEYSFSELCNFFEPEKEEFPELWDRWIEIEDLFDLKAFLDFRNDGMAPTFNIQLIPDDIDVLMWYGCSEREAQNHLSRGTTVYRDLERHFNAYMEEWGIEEDDQEAYRNMVEGGEPVDEWGTVAVDGVKYYIQFCL